MLELILALIGAATLGAIVAVALFVGITTLWYRLRDGVWCWDEATDGLESGRG